MVGRVVLDAVFPPKCALCGVLGERGVCKNCLDEMLFPDPAVFVPLAPMRQREHLFRYEGRARQLVIGLKFERDRSASQAASQLLKDKAQSLGWLKDRLFVPVPIHIRRWAERGFNQSEDLLSCFPRASVSFTVLERVRHTTPQAGLSLAERETNLTDAFQATNFVRGKSVVLVDDVYTSGSTAAECARALLMAGALDVSVLTLTVGQGDHVHDDI